jgi:membrane-associated phospholipid phosphatase
MFESLENGIGLNIVTGLQSNGNGFFDALAKLLDTLGGDLGYLLLLPLIYWSVSRHFGRQLLFVLLVALIGYLGLRELLARPRPYILHPDLVTPLFEEDGFGLPSGHVVLSLVIWGFVAYHVRRWWVWLLLAIYVLLIGWSRMYAGVHYPQDVVAGLVVGGLLLWFSLRFVGPAAEWWRRASFWQRFLFILVSGLVVVMLLHRDETGLSTAGILLGGGAGLMFEERSVNFSSGGSRRERILRSLGGLVLVMAFFFVLDFLFDTFTPAGFWRVVRYAVVSFVLIFVWPWLSVYLGLSTRTHPDPQLQHG